MTAHVHVLAACAPQPLAHYLKALAVLRLLHAQADAGARGRWTRNGFNLRTRLDAPALLSFFLTSWAPTPFLDPWNGGSGFYPKDKAAREQGVDPLLASVHVRFAAYRDAVEVAQLQTRGWTERPGGDGKSMLVARCRNQWSDAALTFFRAAVVQVGDDERYPALFGTGGNDGRLDYCANYMQRLWHVFDPATGGPRPESAGLLRSALFEEPVDGLGTGSVGQFLPGGAGGANATDGFSADALVNPWDFLLMLEGGVGLAVAAVRALDTAQPPQAAAPFAFAANAAGYGTACAGEESPRGEQWMPLWAGWSTWPEVRAMFRAGRTVVRDRRRAVVPARRALDAARAVCQQGVARGITAFQRFAFIERNGQSNLAVPVGRFEVRHRPEVGLLDPVAEWAGTLRRAADTASLKRCLRDVEDAMMRICRGGGPTDWQALVIALGEAELNVVRRPRDAVSKGLTPLPRLEPEVWGRLGDAPEVTLAAALAACSFDEDGKGDIRPHLAPVDSRSARRFEQSDDRLRIGPDLVWTGRSVVDDLAAIVERRLLAAKRAGQGWFPMHPGGVAADPGNVVAFLAGGLDDVRLGQLIRGSAGIAPPGAGRGPTALPADMPPSYAVLRLVYWPFPAPGGESDSLDPRPASLLAAGRYAAAVEAAAQRLGTRGSRVKVRTGLGTPADARRLLASLAFPLHARFRQNLLDLAARRPPSTSEV